MFDFLKVRDEDAVRIIVLSRPEKLNAWHGPMRQELRTALDDANNDDGVRAVVLTGEGDRAFSAGQDLAESQRFNESHASGWIDEWRALYGTLRGMNKGVVASLNGVAAGSAFQVALLCDIRVGHAGSKMGQPEIKSGIPSTLGPWLMREMLGLSRTIDLTLTGRLMSGEEAHALGLIHYLVEPREVMKKSLEMAAVLAAQPPVALRLDKERFREVTRAGFEEALEAGVRNQTQAYATGEPQRMMEAFFRSRQNAG